MQGQQQRGCWRGLMLVSAYVLIAGAHAGHCICMQARGEDCGLEFAQFAAYLICVWWYGRDWLGARKSHSGDAEDSGEPT